MEPPAPGDEHGLARKQFRKTLDVKLHRVAAQQVFKFDFARTGPLLPQPFIGPWQRHERQSRLGGSQQDIPSSRRPGAMAIKAV
jgi:hypothetical protein